MALIRFLLLAIFLFFVLFPTFSQEESPDLGYPEITNFSPKDWQGPPQCWSIMEDDRGVMYFGLSGIMEYDGVNWIPVRNSEKYLKVGRSLAKDANGRIYAGGVGNLGYLKLNVYGETEFVSLKDKIPSKHQEFADVWRIFFRDSSVFFTTYYSIFHYKENMDSMEVWTFDKPIMVQLIDNTNYIVQESIGLQVLSGDTLILAPSGEFLADKPIINFLPYNEDTLLVITQTAGLYLYDGVSFMPFAQDLNPLITTYTLAISVVLTDGKFAIISNGNGVYIINRQGELVQHLNSSTGLAKEQGFCSFVDSKGMLWVGMSGCISRIETESPFSYYDKRVGLESWVLATQYSDGILYVGAETALFYFDVDERKFKFIKGMGLVNNWALCKGNGVLLAGNAEGVYRVEGKRAYPIIKNPVFMKPIFDIQQSKVDSSLILCGSMDGIFILRWEHNLGWQDNGIVSGFNNLAYKLVEFDAHTWWASSAWSGGIHKIKFTKLPQLADPEIVSFGNEDNINETWIAMLFDGKIYSFKGDTLVHYIPDLNRFFPDSTFDINISGALGATHDQFWVSNKAYDDRLCYITSYGNGNYTYTDVPFKPYEGEFFSNIYVEPNGNIAWLGTNERLIRYDIRKQKSMTSDRVPIIRKVSDRFDSLMMISEAQLSIPYTRNRMRIEYAYPYYEQEERNQYSTWMEGMDETWSDWSDETYKEFMNLPGGDYTFRVKAKNIYGEESGDAVYHFRILPPWWQSWWAFCIYGVIGIILLYFVDRIQRKRLLKMEWEKAREKELAYSREIQKAYDELKATQAQLIQSEKMASLGELTAGIAHEIQNPLNFVNNFSEVNKDLAAEIRREVDLGNWEEVKALSKDIEANEEKIAHHGKRAEAIVKSMLQHSRSNAGKPEPTDLNALADEYLRLAYHGMRAKDKTFNAEIITDFDESIGEIKVVSQDIGRVLLNLVTNAFYAVMEGTGSRPENPAKGAVEQKAKPTVTVITRKLSDRVEIRIRDNGNGIPAEIREKIFQPFFTTKPTGKGTGLGLSLSYDIVKAHGGNLTVESTNGNGAEFLMHLPL